MASGLIFITWVLILVFIVLLLAGSMTKSPVIELATAAVLWIFVVSALFYTGLAFLLKCPSCNRRFLVESLDQKHRNAHKLKGLDHWATTVIDIGRNKRFTCMYCGQTFELPTKD
jgi:hypothetical protein